MDNVRDCFVDCRQSPRNDSFFQTEMCRAQKRVPHSGFTRNYSSLGSQGIQVPGTAVFLARPSVSQIMSAPARIPSPVPRNRRPRKKPAPNPLNTMPVSQPTACKCGSRHRSRSSRSGASFSALLLARKKPISSAGFRNCSAGRSTSPRCHRYRWESCFPVCKLAGSAHPAAVYCAHTLPVSPASPAARPGSSRSKWHS
jgi:hypothetical protein